MVSAKIFHLVSFRAINPSIEYNTLENIRAMRLNHDEDDLNISQQTKMLFLESINNVMGSDSIQNIKKEIFRKAVSSPRLSDIQE